MKIKTLTILAALATAINAQATPNSLVKDIIIDSQVYYYYGTSRIKSTTEYDNNLPIKTTGYYKSGQKSYLKSFSGQNISESKIWYAHGPTRSESLYSNGKIKVYKDYHPTGLLNYIAYYTDGELTSEVEYYDKNTIMSEVVYVNNSIQWEKVYYRSGAIKRLTAPNKNNILERVLYDINGKVESIFLLPAPFPVDQLGAIVNRNGNLVTFYVGGGIESITKLTYSKTTKIQPEDEYFKQLNKDGRPEEKDDIEDYSNTENYKLIDPLRPKSFPKLIDNFPPQENDEPMMGFYEDVPSATAGVDPVEIEKPQEDLSDTTMGSVNSETKVEFYASGDKKSETEYFRGEPYKKIDYDEYGLIVDIYTSFTKEDGWVK